MEEIFLYPNFLSTEECDTFRKEIEQKKPESKVCFTNTGIFENDKYIDQKLADRFFTKLQGLVPEGLAVIRPNKLIMTGQYMPGMSFNLHTDTGLYYDRVGREKSRYTLLIYLHP